MQDHWCQTEGPGGQVWPGTSFYVKLIMYIDSMSPVKILKIPNCLIFRHPIQGFISSLLSGRFYIIFSNMFSNGWGATILFGTGRSGVTSGEHPRRQEALRHLDTDELMSTWKPSSLSPCRYRAYILHLRATRELYQLCSQAWTFGEENSDSKHDSEKNENKANQGQKTESSRIPRCRFSHVFKFVSYSWALMRAMGVDIFLHISICLW